MPAQTYSLEQFGQKIKEKYPEYQNVDDRELGQKILEKYPEYGDRINIQTNDSSNIQPSTNYSDYSSLQPVQSDGFLKSVVKSVVSPVAKLSTSAQNAVANTGNVFDALKNEYNKTGSISQTLKNAATGKVMSKDSSQQSRDFSLPIIPGIADINLGKFDPAFTGQESTLGAVKKMGSYGAQIASMIVPAGEVGVGVKGIAGTAGRFGTANALGDIGSQLESNKPFDIKQTLRSFATGAALPVVGRGASKLFKGVGNVSADLLGKTTGTSGDVVREAFKNPNVIKFARQAEAKGGADLQKQALEEAQQGFQKLIKNKGEEYVASLDKIKTNPQELQGILPDLKNKLDQHLENYDIKIGRDGKLDFSNSALDHSNALQKAYNTVNSWTDMSAAGIDRLKKKLGQFADQVPSTEQRGGIANIINDLKGSTRQHLNEKVPGYQEMTSKYAKASDLHDEIKKALSLGDNVSQDTAIRKLMSTVRDNNDLRKEFVNTLSGASGSDITGKLAGAALSPNFARGLSGKIATGAIGVGGVAHFLQPSAVPLILTYVAASSPRLVGELTSLIGKATKPMIAANKFSPQIQNGLRILLQKSLGESNR